MIWALRAGAALFGLGIVMAGLGYGRILQSIFGPSDDIVPVLLFVAFACGAAGPWLARRVAIASLRARLGAAVTGPGGQSAEQSVPRVVDDGFHSGAAWLFQSALGVVLGLLIVAGLACSDVVRRAWPVLASAFFWTPVTGALCRAVLTALVVGLPSAVAGLQLAGLYVTALRTGADTAIAASARSRPRRSRVAPIRYEREQHRRASAAIPGYRHSPAGVAPGLLVGAALGLAVCARFATSGLAAEQWVLLGATTMFVLSANSAWMTRRLERLTPPRAIHVQDVPLTWARRSRMLIASAAFAWGAAVGLAGGVWALMDASQWSAGPSWMLMAAGAVGAWSTGRGAANRKYSMGGYGMALWAAGLGIMAVMVVAAAAAARPAASLPLSAMIVVAAGILGYSLSYGRRVLVGRAASEAAGLSEWLAAVFLGISTGALAHACQDRTWPAGVGELTAASLLLLVFGGLLQIHEQGGVRRVRQRRLGLVFASLGLAIAVLPGSARRIVHREPLGWNAAAEETGGSGRYTWERILGNDFGAAFPGARVLYIGSDSFGIDGAVQDIERAPWQPTHEGRYGRSDARASSLRLAEHVWPSADHWFRFGRRRYDFIFQACAGLRSTAIPSRLTREWLEGLRDRLLPTGTVAVELPLPLMDAVAVRSAASTFQRVFSGYDHWLLIVDDADLKAAFVIAAPPAGPSPRSMIGRSPEIDRVTLARLDAVPDRDQSACLHTIRSPAFRMNRARPLPDAVDCYRSLAQRPSLGTLSGGR